METGWHIKRFGASKLQKRRDVDANGVERMAL